MKLVSVLAAALVSLPAMVVAAPVGPSGPCPALKVDAILKGVLDASACCSYGTCKGDVVVSVG
ncbi:hypothetical protein E4U22_005693 [Claviceps purpurea]|uniref:Uncharacterized protein n=1 Tax=Claviceps purpurea (strain 20.1) TaxID=1111077 RepID=M1W9D2_CLAP2|nr:hypothetical protein E4U19_001587 [Claviceps sp. Clav32 group G5]KAG6045460.1 hypothetical protein E4U39_002362 [Claviceps sp. Clav50 group G5]KAG6058971.1 hypothetical protein E4U17_007193 [Claviceps sp. LM77 group G4]KAG6082587.1 hypothetical protein E4U16_005824 [Claviceps sp. LM84 group G4]KAG6127192.1 hypothetical protein E4U28_000217 [Claviceps purpurea]CCE29788.1 uncharacterized protein CPUR_03635 [Claviceps purpurea 20.1]